MLQIGIVDDHPIVQDGIHLILKSIINDFEFYSAENGAKALQMIEKQAIDLVFLDISLPDIHGNELCKQIRTNWKQIKIIGLSVHQESAIVADFIKNGGNGFISKSAERSEYLKCIESVMQNQTYLGSEIKDDLLLYMITPKEINNFPSLTRREREIIELLTEGLTGPQIAKALFISPLTVETHRKNILQKYQVNNFQSLISKLRKLGILN
ncbi:MAG: response regulator transcription factor [Saprospiraceae bacterium]|nr:response regulator transcription factor [Saprospiraceae bacterium]MBK7811992.1 response regulator transcription factor [Saprospiraceae bacterium]MBK9632801.1 response regulator transcription factor [Saprospiraceae bacterium]